MPPTRIEHEGVGQQAETLSGLLHRLELHFHVMSTARRRSDLAHGNRRSIRGEDNSPGPDFSNARTYRSAKSATWMKVQ
ncbi:MAG: hypothetical protein IPM24_25245 [Bryobacterales bacterium]|nr:hypothetical protein [Bryobacterales bacterium]